MNTSSLPIKRRILVRLLNYSDARARRSSTRGVVWYWEATLGQRSVRWFLLGLLAFGILSSVGIQKFHELYNYFDDLLLQQIQIYVPKDEDREAYFDQQRREAARKGISLSDQLRASGIAQQAHSSRER